MSETLPDKYEQLGISTQRKSTSGALVEVEQQRAIAETQAAMIIAKRFPRDYIDAVERIKTACTRQGLAESALYSYSKGGTDITGPSIRLAEAIAQNWGNIQFGLRELEKRDGVSTVEAFAWDIETNVRQVKTFQVTHQRYSKARGVQELTDPREIYEMVANQGARRLRACILGIVPGDVVEDAVKQCEQTLTIKAEVTPEKVKSIIEKFAAFKVTKDQLEKRIQRRIDAITPALMVQLGKIYNSLKDGMSKPEDWFEKKSEAESINEVVSSKKEPDVSTPPASKQEQEPAEPTKFTVAEIDGMSIEELKIAIQSLEASDKDGLVTAMQACQYSNMPAAKTALQRILKEYYK
jgi:hypothetical protein